MERRLERRDYAEAGKEVPTAIIFALLPILLGLLFSIALARSAGSKQFICDFLASGEALLISSGLRGPLLYIITKKYGDFPKSFSIAFPSGWFCAISVFAVCIVASAMFGAQRAMSQAAVLSVGGAESIFDRGTMQWISAIALVFACTLLYYTTALRNWADRQGNVPGEMRDEQERFRKQFGASS